MTITVAQRRLINVVVYSITSNTAIVVDSKHNVDLAVNSYQTPNSNGQVSHDNGVEIGTVVVIYEIQ